MDLIDRQSVKELAHKQVREKYCGMAFKKHRDFYIKLADSIIDLLPSAQPDIIYCGECTKMKVDSIFHDCWCSETGKKVWINHYCGYAERREVTT